MTQALMAAGWIVGVGALAAAAITGCRTAVRAEAVACACHELRGPLTAARLGLEIALRAGETAEARLEAIGLELERASLAVDDLAEVWRRPPALRRSQALLAWDGTREQIDVADLLAESVGAWQGAAASHGVALRLADAGVRPVVWGNRLRLAQATGNLIANGIEHGGGEVEVSWRVDPGAVRIEVTDRGAGLTAPVAELARRRTRAWAPFRGGRFAGRERLGTRRGHGLAIASAIAAAHGGRLAAAPSQQGARLLLELPAAGRVSPSVG